MTPVPTRWRKSSRSAEETDCVELAYVGIGIGAVRDSKNPAGPTLNVDMAGLLDAVKAGRFSRKATFFAAMYYAGLRPEDAVNLRKENLSLPAEVWNEKERRWDLPEDATRYHTLTLRSSMVHLPLNAACERSVDQGKLRHIYAKRG